MARTRSGKVQLLYGQLATLKDFIPEGLVPGSFVDLFHGLLDELENIVGDLTRHRVPDSAISLCPQTNVQTCAAACLQAKVEDVMNLFICSDEEGNREFGFVSPE